MRPNIGRRSLPGGFAWLGGLAGGAAGPEVLAASDDPLDVLALERLLLEQGPRELVEDRPVLFEQDVGAAKREVRDVLLLVVDQPPGGIRDRVIVRGEPARDEP